MSRRTYNKPLPTWSELNKDIQLYDGVKGAATANHWRACSIQAVYDKKSVPKPKAITLADVLASIEQANESELLRLKCEIEFLKKRTEAWNKAL